MNKKKYDVAIVGGGHNGLTTACYLAKAGLDVVVVERHNYVGGAAVSREIHPGWTYSNCSYVCSLLRPEIFRDLELAKHGLQIIPYEGSATMLDNGDFYGSYNDHDLNYRSMSKFSAKDAEAYERFSRDVMRQCKIIKPLLKMTPPDPTSFAPKDIMGLFEFAKHFAGKDELGGIGEKEIHETIRFWTMSVRDYLEEYFESEVIKAHMAGSAIIGTALGPYSPGSAYVLLHHYMGEVDGNVGASDTNLTLSQAPTSDGTSAISAPFYLVIDPDSATNREVILVTASSGVNMSTVTRDVEGRHSPDISHSDGTTVRMAVVAEMFEDLHDQLVSGTITFTNKTFDAEATGNALSNVDVANLKSGVLDTDISSVSGSDDTLASAKATKTYVDAQVATKASLGLVIALG